MQLCGSRAGQTLGSFNHPCQDHSQNESRYSNSSLIILMQIHSHFPQWFFPKSYGDLNTSDGSHSSYTREEQLRLTLASKACLSYKRQFRWIKAPIIYPWYSWGVRAAIYTTIPVTVQVRVLHILGERRS